MILIDSDVLIAHLRGHEAARGWLHAARGRDRLAASAVVLCEVSGGMRSGERREVARLLSALRPLPVDATLGYRAGQLMRRWRRSHSGIGLGDYLVAASAELHAAELGHAERAPLPHVPRASRPVRRRLTGVSKGST